MYEKQSCRENLKTEKYVKHCVKTVKLAHCSKHSIQMNCWLDLPLVCHRLYVELGRSNSCENASNQQALKVPLLAGQSVVTLLTVNWPSSQTESRRAYVHAGGCISVTRPQSHTVSSTITYQLTHCRCSIADRLSGLQAAVWVSLSNNHFLSVRCCKNSARCNAGLMIITIKASSCIILDPRTGP